MTARTPPAPRVVSAPGPPVPHLYPARMFISVDFPDPEGPMMPMSSLLQNLPDRHFSKALNPIETHKHVVKGPP